MALLKQISYTLILSLCGIVFLYSCIDSNKEKQTKAIDSNHVKIEQVCIKAILAQDASLGKTRNNACKNISLSETIQQYVSSVNKLDFENCPEDFKKAFENHMKAWSDMIVVTDQHPNLRGEMHDLFDQIEAGEFADQFTPLLKNIRNSWELVESAKN